jgi:hypothetical protein
MSRRSFIRAFLASIATPPLLAITACEKGQWDASTGTMVFRRGGSGRND